MRTLFDIGDEINVTLKGRIIEYSASQSGDCYTIELTDQKNQRSRVYLSSSDLENASIKEGTTMITAKIESMAHIPKTCAECRLQGKDSQCAALSDEHQSCPVTFYQELLKEAGNDVFKTGRRCLCPLNEEEEN